MQAWKRICEVTCEVPCKVIYTVVAAIVTKLTSFEPEICIWNQTSLEFNLVARAIRNAIRANRFARIIRNWNPYFYSASGRFARSTRISDSRESPDSRESCESIRANHATKEFKEESVSVIRDFLLTFTRICLCTVCNDMITDPNPKKLEVGIGNCNFFEVIPKN